MTAVAPAEFVAELRALAPRYWDSHPFHLRMHAGQLGKHELQAWAANRWYYQRCIAQKDAAILSNCPSPEIRRQWRERIIWHDGTQPGEGGAENWIRLAEAVGLTREEVLDERHVLPGTRFAVDAYVNFARTQPWVIGIASGLTEMFSGALMRKRLAALREQYPWIAEEGFAYFTNRIKAVAGEGQATLDIVVEHSVTREQQLAAVSALSFKCDVLRAVLDAVDYYSGKGQAVTTVVALDAVPRIRRGVKCTYDQIREAHVVLFPEGVLVLNETAASVVALCDGVRSVGDIAVVLADEYDGVEPEDIASLVARMVERRVVDVDG